MVPNVNWNESAYAHPTIGSEQKFDGYEKADDIKYS